MSSLNRLKELEEARRKQKEARERLLRKMRAPKSKPVKHLPQFLGSEPKLQPINGLEPAPSLSVDSQYGQAHVPIYRDDEMIESVPSKALQQLIDLYLHAAQHGTRHIALVWPASPRTQILAHALATLERWVRGDKYGIRGLVYPVKSNAFYPLNHLHFDRQAILKLARRLVEVQGIPNDLITRPFREKDAYLFSLASLKSEERERFNPTIGELLPHFMATVDFNGWKSCAHRLLMHIRAKLQKRAQANALQVNCAVIGDPETAPDAIFALDGRLDKETLRRSLMELRGTRQPEVVLVNATRVIRKESRGWKAALGRFCLLIEEVFPDSTPGVIVVTDEPHAAFRLKDRLWELNNKRGPTVRWHTPHEYSITGMPCTAKYEQDGLVPPEVTESVVPVPREFDVVVVDSEAAKVVNKLARIANKTPGGWEAAKPVIDAAGYLTRMAALPCGVSHLVEWLSSAEVDQQMRTRYDWLTYVGALRQFDRDGGAAEDRKWLLECIDMGSALFERYQIATPFALRLAEVVCRAADSNKMHVTVVFTNALYRRLAEQFLSAYSDYPDERKFSDFSGRVQLITVSQFEESISELSQTVLVFAGLNDEGLRIVLTDDRIPPHTRVLLTQRGGQYLRSSLKPIAEYFPEFKAFKPRIESILRQLKDLPANASVLSTSDFVLQCRRTKSLAVTKMLSILW
jgi:hypothetical protein